MITSLIRNERLNTLIEPLRIVAMSNERYKLETIELSLDALKDGESPEAVRALTQFADNIPGGAVADEIVANIVRAAAGAQRGDVGHLGPNRRTDPAALRFVAEMQRAGLLRVLDQMLRGPLADSGLVLPPGTFPADDEPAQAFQRRERATAAAAIAILSSQDSSLVEVTLPYLIRNVVIEDDRYDTYAGRRVAKTLAIVQLLGIGDVQGQLDALGASAPDEHRERYFTVWKEASHLLDVDAHWREDGDPDFAKAVREELRDALFAHLLSFAGGRWGSGPANDAARIIERFARDDHAWALSHLEGMFGAALSGLQAAAAAKPAPLQLPNATVDAIAGMNAFADRAAYSGATSRYLECVEHAADADAVAVIDTIVGVLEQHRDQPTDDQQEELAWLLIKVLGKIGDRAGDQLGVLARIVPILYRYMVETEPGMSSAAINAWSTIGTRHSLPSTFQDLLPAFTSNQYVAVIRAVLTAAVRLTLTDYGAGYLLQFSERLAFVLSPNEPGSELLKDAVHAVVVLGNRLPTFRDRAHSIALKKCADVGDEDLEDVLRLKWNETSLQSVEMSRLRLRQIIFSDLRQGRQDHEDSRLVDLLKSVGVQEIPRAEIESIALSIDPRYALRSLEIAEALWRVRRTQDFVNVLNELSGSLPSTPAFDPQRDLVELVRAAAQAELDPPQGNDIGDDVRTEQDQRTESRFAVQARIRRQLRRLLTSETEPDDQQAERASRVREAAKQLRATSQRTTPTAAYVRAYASFMDATSHIVEAVAAERDGDVQGRKTAIRSARRNLSDTQKQLRKEFTENDPLLPPLHAAVGEMNTWITDELPDDLDVELREFAAIPVPLIIVQGAPLTKPDRHPRSRKASEPQPIAVVLLSVNRQLLTGTAVMKQNDVYTLGARVHLESWPDWAERLDLELISPISRADVDLPTMSWSKPTEGTQDLTFIDEGTVMLRYGVTAGQPAPAFLVKLTLRGTTKDNKRRSLPLDVAGHPQIKMRPHDSSRDSITAYEAIDERLLDLYTALPEAGYNEDEIQAFCRLFAAICRIGLEMTWERKYKRGQRVLERTFHDDLFDLLMEEPELGGRVERGTPSAHGFLDIRHDGITAELKVERKTAVTRDRAAKYMAQVVQYGVSNGRRLSILAILDMSPKELPIGTPENYMFPLHPAQHGIDSPTAPSTVYTLVVNGNLPVPSAWSRRSTGKQREL